MTNAHFGHTKTRRREIRYRDGNYYIFAYVYTFFPRDGIGSEIHSEMTNEKLRLKLMIGLSNFYLLIIALLPQKVPISSSHNHLATMWGIEPA